MIPTNGTINPIPTVSNTAASIIITSKIISYFLAFLSISNSNLFIVTLILLHTFIIFYVFIIMFLTFRICTIERFLILVYLLLLRFPLLLSFLVHQLLQFYNFTFDHP